MYSLQSGAELDKHIDAQSPRCEIAGGSISCPLMCSVAKDQWVGQLSSLMPMGKVGRVGS